MVNLGIEIIWRIVFFYFFTLSLRLPTTFASLSGPQNLVKSWDVISCHPLNPGLATIFKQHFRLIKEHNDILSLFSVQFFFTQVPHKK